MHGWNNLNGRFGSPTPHGKYPRTATTKDKNTLADALKARSNDGYLMTSEDMDIALLESKLSGNVTTQQQLVYAKQGGWLQAYWLLGIKRSRSFPPTGHA